MAKALAFQGLCRLQVDSTSQLSLQRFQGAWLPIKASGAWQASLIPTSGPTVSNSGLVTATLHYVYAFDSAGTLTLEVVTTAPATDADTGIRIKTGDATRTLVGMIFTDAGTPGTFADSLTKRWCFNWFQRRDLPLTNTFSADRTKTNTSPLEEINTEIRLQSLAWADEAMILGASGSVENSGAGQASYTVLGVDSTSVSTQTSSFTSTGAGLRGPIGLHATVTLSEGSHFVTLLAAVSGGTATWRTADNLTNGDAKTRLWGTVRG
jgi:hypothetical protein